MYFTILKFSINILAINFSSSFCCYGWYKHNNILLGFCRNIKKVTYKYVMYDTRVITKYLHQRLGIILLIYIRLCCLEVVFNGFNLNTP